MLLAVSGGVDSTALLLLFADLRAEGWEVSAAHVNHHLRGTDSDDDEHFVRELCARLGVRLEVCDGTLDAERIRAVGIEAAAREMRYRCLAEVRERVQAHFLATAHQQDDQAETVLMRMVGGGGLASLRGVHALRDGWIIRPLLGLRRAALETFLATRGITPRHDVSNEDPRFLRNRVRRVLRELDGTSGLARIASELQAQWPLIDEILFEANLEHVAATPTEARFRSFPANAWLRQALLHHHIVRLDRSARDVSAADLERLSDEVERVRRITVTKRLEIVHRGAEWILRPRPEPTSDFEVTITPGAPVWLPESKVTLHLDRQRGAADTSLRHLVQLPPGATPSFVVRNRRNGDRFQPLGLAQPKKLKDFLIDRRIAVELRDAIPLLLWNDTIVLVAGVEVSEAFKVTASEGERFHVWLEGPGAEDQSDRADLQR